MDPSDLDISNLDGTVVTKFIASPQFKKKVTVSLIMDTQLTRPLEHKRGVVDAGHATQGTTDTSTGLATLRGRPGRHQESWYPVLLGFCHTKFSFDEHT
jgi:hypothetical protein